MTAISPLRKSSSLATFSITSDGQEIPKAFQVVSIDTWSAVNRLPRAQLVLFDGSPSKSTFEISSLDTFLPGKKIDVALGYEGKNTRVFRGVVVKQGIEIDRSQGSKLVVEVVDEVIKMTLARKNAVFEKFKDSSLIGKLLGDNGLGKKITATTVEHPEIVQYYASDWDLMLMRSEQNGFVVIPEAGTVTVGPPDTSQSPDLVVKYGDSILDLEAEMDAATQLDKSAITSTSWDVATQKLAEAGPGTVTVKEPGNVSSDKLAEVFKVKKFLQQTGGTVAEPSLKEWSSAELQRSKLSKIRGWVRFQGSALAQTGKTLELAGLGPRFNGSVYLSGVHHSMTEGRWTTTADFGLTARWFAATAPEIAAPEASGQLPPIEGLQTGIVKKIVKDPAGEFRVFVQLPLLQAGSKGVWARLGTFYGSDKVGAVFYPEVNDEVVLGFMNEDPRYPVILGSVFSKKHSPPYPPDDKNSKKAIVTKSKLEITFDDKDKILEIRTPGKHIIKMDDKSGALSIRDSNKNNITLSKGGITLDSASNIKIKAKSAITLDAGTNLKLAAKANASLEGLQVANKAKSKFSAKGNATAEVTSTGMLTVRGSLVKIN